MQYDFTAGVESIVIVLKVGNRSYINHKLASASLKNDVIADKNKIIDILTCDLNFSEPLKTSSFLTEMGMGIETAPHAGSQETNSISSSLQELVLLPRVSFNFRRIFTSDSPFYVCGTK